LGVVFYEMLAGKRPFDGGSSAATMHAVLNDTPTPLASPFNGVVQRCLAKDPSQRYANAGEVVAALKGREPAATRKQPPVAVWFAMALSIGVALWLTLGRSPKPPQVPATPGAQKRAVAVLEFDNLSGDPALDWMKKGASELVGSALVQSPDLDVYDGQRLTDLLANEKTTKLDNAFLAKHGITRAIDGTILKSGSQLQVLGRIVDTKDGRPVRSYNVSGPADSGLFHVVGGLIPNLQVALEVNLTGDKEAEGWLREITTTSADAYRLYLRGHQALLASHWKESAAAYEKAVEIDPDFAAAWSEMSGAYWNLDDAKNLERARANMRRLRPTADHRTQLKIDLQEAVVADDPPGIVRAASELAQLYPENRFYTYLLGRGYYRTHQWRRVLETLAPLVEQRYSWAYTYVLSARSAAHLGDSTKARALYQTGLEVSHAEPELAYPYAQFLHLLGDNDAARKVIDAGLASPTLAEGPIAEGELRLELARNYALRGDDAHAKEQLLKASPLIPKDDEAREDADSLLKHFGLAR